MSEKKYTLTLTQKQLKALKNLNFLNYEKRSLN